MTPHLAPSNSWKLWWLGAIGVPAFAILMYSIAVEEDRATYRTLVAISLVAAVVMLRLGRLAVSTAEDGIQVANFFRRHQVAWPEAEAVARTSETSLLSELMSGFQSPYRLILTDGRRIHLSALSSSRDADQLSALVEQRGAPSRRGGTTQWTEPRTGPVLRAPEGE